MKFFLLCAFVHDAYDSSKIFRFLVRTYLSAPLFFFNRCACSQFFVIIQSHFLLFDAHFILSLAFDF